MCNRTLQKLHDTFRFHLLGSIFYFRNKIDKNITLDIYYILFFKINSYIIVDIKRFETFIAVIKSMNYVAAWNT